MEQLGLVLFVCVLLVKQKLVGIMHFIRSRYKKMSDFEVGHIRLGYLR